MLSPSNVIGCKRLCVDTGYWETYNRPNVMLIDVGDKPIEMFTPAGIRAKVTNTRSTPSYSPPASML